MQLELDIGQVRGCMKLWREAVETRLDVCSAATNADSAKLLAGAAACVAAWLELLRMCRAEESSFQQLTAELQVFQAWAAEGVHALELIQATEQPPSHTGAHRARGVRTRNK